MLNGKCAGLQAIMRLGDQTYDICIQQMTPMGLVLDVQWPNAHIIYYNLLSN